MPGLLLDMDPATTVPGKAPEYGFVVSHQKVELEVDFAAQSLSGRTEITILPQQRDLKTIKFDARQCTIPPRSIMVNGVIASHSYSDPLKALEIPKHILWTANQFEMQKDRLKPLVEEDTRANGALHITIPRSVRIEEVDPYSDSAANALTNRAIGASAARHSSIVVNGGNSEPLSAAPGLTPKTAAEQSARFQPLVISIPFSTKDLRDGLHFVGVSAGDDRYPHVYTRHSMDPGVACSIFPCIDDPAMRCTWEISIKCSRTLGDALKQGPETSNPKGPHHSKKGQANGIMNGINGLATADEYEVSLADDETLLEMQVVCSGETTNEVVDLEDTSKKTVSFYCGTVVAAQHIGFAIGPFEQIDLTDFREEDDEKLGQAQLVPVWGYCLPGRAEELRHSCDTVVPAVDWFLLNFGSSFPFPEFKLVFVDDQIMDVEHTASLSICSARLLHPDDIIDLGMETTRTLAHAIASQWIGVGIVPNERADRWVTIGLSHFMAGLFMRYICGNNDYAFRQKQLSDKLVELDIKRPSLAALGEILTLGSFEYNFMVLKAPLVLFILDKRIIKNSGSAGLTRVISKIITAANTGGAGDSVLSTESLRKQCEKITKYRDTERFWNQWVLGAGCPRFSISQKFNKKRLCVEMKIIQKQDTLPTQQPLKKGVFLREFKEEVNGVFAGDLQPVFTGPMTIRIHEADGTPYEHIVEIREGSAQIEIPYNTKYKRLKRTRRQRERANAGAGAGADVGAEIGEDALIYCLGDILQSPQEMQEWGLQDWDQDQQIRMEQESYEWIRIDADFEWLAKIEFVSMPPYMYISQLQQDRDVVAQQESMLWLKTQPPHPLAATFLVRTAMDGRYFHGIRTMAVECLKTHAHPACNSIGFRHLEKAFQELFCYPGTRMPRANDFTDKQSYLLLKSIPKAVAQIRGPDGRCPREAREFLLDQLRFNDNTGNEFSDNYKVAGLLSALAECLIPESTSKNQILFEDDEENDEPSRFRDTVIEELDRYRRMDDWNPSHHNIYTVTSLDCKHKLMAAGVIPVDPIEFIPFTHDGTSDYIRIKAFEALMDLGFIMNNTLVKYLLNVASTDKSPYVRLHLFDALTLGLATVALGDAPKKPAKPPPTADGDTLIIEGEASNEERKALIARTSSIEGALAALKEELKENPVLKEALWKAVKSPSLNAYEQTDFLDICWIFYDPIESMIVNLKLPRYYEATNLGKVCGFIVNLFCFANPLSRELSNSSRQRELGPRSSSSPNQNLRTCMFPRRNQTCPQFDYPSLQRRLRLWVLLSRLLNPV
jgi:transcription initiation factor TFIID subunit 2